MTKEEFEWSWAQSPDFMVISTLKAQGHLWGDVLDRCWLYAGPLYVATDPTTLCPCTGSPGRIVDLVLKANMINDQTKVEFRIAIGLCDKCGKFYWQADNVDVAVGFE